MPVLRDHDDDAAGHLVSRADVVVVRVSITTKGLHRSPARRSALEHAAAQTEALGHRLVGEPWIEGDLGGDQVELVWSATRG